MIGQTEEGEEPDPGVRFLHSEANEESEMATITVQKTFASLSPWRGRPGYSTTVEDSVYVDRAHQGMGVGSALLGEVLSVARLHGFHAVMARIAAGHQPSRGLHERFGFEHVGTEREVGRKFGRWIDIDLLQLILT